MNLDMIRPRNGTEGLLLSITKSGETLIKQTHTKPQKSWEFKFTQAKKILPQTTIPS